MLGNFIIDLIKGILYNIIVKILDEPSIFGVYLFQFLFPQKFSMRIAKGRKL